MRSDIVPGGIFPDYELPDQTGSCASSANCRARIHSSLRWRAVTIAQRSTSSIWNSPRSTRRSRWRTLRSPRSPPTITIPSRNSARQWEPSGPSFRTPNEPIQKDLDIQEYTDPEHNPMIPHTLVLKPGLVIYSIYNGYWFWGRPSIADLWRDLRTATSEVRPDWDLSTPGLRDAWNVATYRGFTDGTRKRRALRLG